ncbi:MAG: alanine racemase [Phototrophicales bacterium]|nr:MAG: alanine racemase [Phototrophicales bacterium]RMG77352.1 MAG: D-TA family PLP-dependent enzyme [Chloroflexota bacterium]
MHVNELETPSVLIDLDKMMANIQRMQAYCDSLGVAFRPHIKTHKLPQIAQMQLEAGAVGIACQKTTEAQVFLEAGFKDIQIPYNIVGQAKTRRLAQMAATPGVKITTAADHVAIVDGLAQAASDANVTLHVLADMATSIQRTGAQPKDIVTIAKRIDAAPNLEFAGLMVYPSDASIRPALLETLTLLEQAGLQVKNISGGGTGGALEAAQVPELTELRVGTYVFYDWTCVVKGWTSIDNCAMRVAATVISTPSSDRVILDSGRKSIASDTIDGGYGHLVEYPDAHIYALSEEHTHVDVSRCDRKPMIGERVHIIPVHTCVVTNLHNQIYGIHGEQVEVVWQVAARGMVW